MYDLSLLPLKEVSSEVLPGEAMFSRAVCLEASESVVHPATDRNIPVCNLFV